MPATELATLLRDNLADILLPKQENVQEALNGVKTALDPLAKQYSVFDQLHVDGLATEQVYLQAEMIVDGALRGIFSEVESLLPAEEDPSELSEGNSDEEAGEGAEEEEDDDEEEDDEQEEEIDLENLQDDYVESDFEGFDEEDDGNNEIESPETAEPQSKRKKIAGLEDDGFDLSEYQKHVLALEQQDNEDDDDDIDYFAETKKESDSDEDIYYEDFFGKRPKQQQSKSQPQVADDVEDDESGSDDGMGEAEAAVRKDLFDSEPESGDDDNEPSENLSRFERQQREIEAQIKELERENVGDKDWGMKGEIRASQRPQDSLVNAELEFERNAKPAPVITQEVTQELDDLIKDRIRKEQFDDLPRRTLMPQMKKSRELPEVQETKSEKSLAELYEEDHARKSNPEFFTQQAKEGLERHHKEVIDAFAVVSRKLDALCSWNYTPRAPEPGVEVKTNAPAISMEEAQPGAMSLEDGLAPQEVYRPDKDGFTASEEMTKSSKKRRQNQRAKAKALKQAEKDAAAGPSIIGDKSKGDSKDKMFKALKRANVSVVDNRGRKRDLRGDKVTEKAPLQASQIKL